MKTLSVRQPWAWLIVHGYKTCENRTWKTDHRGPLAIHASLRIDNDALRRVLESCEGDGEPITPEELQALRTVGAIVGLVDLIDCTKAPQEEDRAYFEPGMWAWILRNPQAIEPIPATGRLGLFDVDL